METPHSESPNLQHWDFNNRQLRPLETSYYFNAVQFRFGASAQHDVPQVHGVALLASLVPRSKNAHI